MLCYSILSQSQCLRQNHKDNLLNSCLWSNTLPCDPAVLLMELTDGHTPRIVIYTNCIHQCKLYLDKEWTDVKLS